MAWAAEDVTLGQASPPGLLIIATSADIGSWTEETFPIPTSLEQSFNQRRLVYMVMRAVSSPAAGQLIAADRNMSYTFVTRSGMTVSPHVTAELFLTALPGADIDVLPICSWTSPFIYPLRGGDSITTFVPGDKDATPTQDWHLEMLFGPELKR